MADSGRKRNEGSNGEKSNIHLTPSADGILDVTPVSSGDQAEADDNDSNMNTSKATRKQSSKRRNANQDAFSSSSDEDKTTESEGEEDGSSHSSSSNDKEETEGASEISSLPSSSSPSKSKNSHSTGWDKVLRSGKPSKGHASDFFAAPSSDDAGSDFLSQADMEVLKEASTAGGDSFDEANAASKAATPRSTSTGSIRRGGGNPNSANSNLGETTAVRPPPPPPPPASSVPHRSAHPASSANSVQSSRSNNSTFLPPPPPPPPGKLNKNGAVHRQHSISSTNSSLPSMRPHPTDEHLNAGVLPDVFMTMRQKIESLTLFDSDMIKYAGGHTNDWMEDEDDDQRESRESLKRSSQQSISASVLVSLAHKRYERRRLAAMEIEKVIRALVHQHEIERCRAILLLLSDDYVRSTNEDARKGGVVALAASAIGLKKAPETSQVVMECRDLILASVVHACQDHSQRVRYYATESLFNVVKVIPSLAVQHFFILFEILRSLYADVDADVRSGAELLDKKLKEVLVSAINSGSFTAEACVPVFARFVHMRNKATNRLTLTWLQELNEKLIGSPILEFLHLFLGGIFNMVADPTVAIRQSALAFLQSVLPKLLVLNSDAIANGDDERGKKIDFDKILQSLVMTMEHPDPFVRKVDMYWMSRIVKAHMAPESEALKEDADDEKTKNTKKPGNTKDVKFLDGQSTAASVSVRNSLPHVLPGIFLSIGDISQPANTSTKEVFLPDQTTRSLAEQTNACLQDAVRRDGIAYVQHLDGLILALREELDAPGGSNARQPPASQRSPYRMDVNPDGTGIESQGWFRGSVDQKMRNDDSMVMSRLCALHWVIVLYESVVPDLLKADYAREFVFAIIHQLVDDPPRNIVYKSLEVLAKITVPVYGEDARSSGSTTTALAMLTNPAWASTAKSDKEAPAEFPMTDTHVAYALDILEAPRRKQLSRNREVFAAIIQLNRRNQDLLIDLSSVITYMCKLQPPEFVLISFSVELDRFLRTRRPPLIDSSNAAKSGKPESTLRTNTDERIRDLKFVSSFVQHMCHVLLNAKEAHQVRTILKDCVGSKGTSERDRQRARLFHILLHSFAHNLPAALTLCLWAGANKTASLVLNEIDPLDIDLLFLLDIDRLVELLERPLFRHLHVRMLESDVDPSSEGSGAMLFQTLKSLLMIVPQSTCYRLLKDRLTSASRFRQSALNTLTTGRRSKRAKKASREPELYVSRVHDVRCVHCAARWMTIRADSLESPPALPLTQLDAEEGTDRRSWLGYASKDDEQKAQKKRRDTKKDTFKVEEIQDGYHDLQNSVHSHKSASLIESEGAAEESAEEATATAPAPPPHKQTSSAVPNQDASEEEWKTFWANGDAKAGRKPT